MTPKKSRRNKRQARRTAKSWGTGAPQPAAPEWKQAAPDSPSLLVLENAPGQRCQGSPLDDNALLGLALLVGWLAISAAVIVGVCWALGWLG